MAFQEMDYYKEGKLPSYTDCNNYEFCRDVSQYRPLDVSGLKDYVENSFGSLIESCENYNKSFNDDLSQLEIEWGTKFISIDNSDANIIDVSKFAKPVGDIIEEINNQKTRFDNFINYVLNITDGINQYLDRLDNNTKDYLSLVDSYNNLIKEYNSLVSRYNSIATSDYANSSQLSSLKLEMENKEHIMEDVKSSIDLYIELPSPNGTWCLQTGV